MQTGIHFENLEIQLGLSACVDSIVDPVSITGQFGALKSHYPRIAYGATGWAMKELSPSRLIYSATCRFIHTRTRPLMRSLFQIQ